MSKPLQQFFGPYSMLIKLIVLGVVTLSLFRVGLVSWQWDRVNDVTTLSEMLLYGLRSDLIITGMLIIPLVLLAPLLAHRHTWQLWTSFILIWGISSIALLIFMEVATPTFIIEYDLRPNRLFVEYLKYPTEVGAMLWKGFRVPLIIGLIVTVLLTLMAIKLIRHWLRSYQPEWSVFRTWLVWPLVVLLVLIMVRSSFSHRPANPSLFARTSDPMVNSLFINSAWSVYFALYNLKYENKSSEIYGALPSSEILNTLHELYPWLKTDQTLYPTLHHQQASVTAKKPFNLVIVLEESLGAEYVASLGGQALTPNLEKLKNDGWWFERLYATGTRSVRGIEAVISGFPPTPARSVVKLSLAQQKFFTLASYLTTYGYQTEFIYGGESHFDNMANFFVGNGFTTVIDERDYVEPKFTGSWGVSDEDLFEKAHQRITKLDQQNQPFLSFIFSSSNHSPYDYPDDTIQQVDKDKHTANNAVLYSDYALGNFIAKAKQSPYWNNTVFLIVADHSHRAGDNNLVPIDDFHIPGLILGAGIKPEKIKTIASQIDLAPTVLSLIGISGHHPMIGRDLTQPEQRESAGRALMQFSDYFALMQDDHVTVLRPGKSAISGRYDLSHNRLDITTDATAEQEKQALTHSLLPSWLYREQKYQSPQN